jgi:trk system potassium uptake protein TrkH
MYLILTAAVFLFIAEKLVRFFNARSKKDYIHFFWFEFVFVALFIVLLFSASALWALGVYLLLQVITKVCRTMVNLAAAGKSPAITFTGSFVVLTLIGAVLLTLPRCHTQPIKFIDALFTSTSAICVTGLATTDIGTNFSIIGQTVILCLTQLGGLGIVIFGAVFAMLFGQSLNVRQAAAMQDLLSAQTMSKIAKALAFVFTATFVIEGCGALCLYKMWDLAAPLPAHITSKWFCSIFHSISAFCNSGLGLFSDSFIKYNFDWRVYGVICPLIILGGLGFGVLGNLYDIFTTKIKNLLSANYNRPVKMELQTKIVLLVTAILIVAGMFGLLIIHNNTTGKHHIDLADAFFQSVTARTAGFNTIDINALSAPAKMILIILMFIGGSPGGTAGGIKTVTLAVIIMAIYATIRKRAEVEIFKRSIPLAIVGKALVVTSLFTLVLFSATFLMTITERHNDFDFINIMFEAASALGTVGLSCGITPALTTAGKIIIIITMLIGRLGPLTLLAVLTFNIKPARYNYPTESVVVG